MSPPADSCFLSSVVPSETGERGSSALALRVACGDAFTGLMGSSMVAPVGPPDGIGAASHGHTLSSSLASSNLVKIVGIITY